MTRLPAIGSLSLLAVIAASGVANADTRFRNRAFTPNEIVTLNAKPGIESAVAFAPDERIENIAVGNSANWEVNANKRANVVFVKPTKARAHTNMTVITNERTYLFDLVSSAPGNPVYMLRFTYPDEPKSAPAPAAASQPVLVADAVVAQPKPRPADLNFAWRAGGEKRLLPASYFDDGSSTFLRWGKETTLPAILVRGPDGAEGPVNYTVQGDYVVVEGVPAQLVLRSGKQVATLTPAPRVAQTAKQTASVEARRSPPAGGRFDQ